MDLPTSTTSAPATIHSLPVELLHKILAGADSEATAQEVLWMALVCRSFATESLALLYATVRLGSVPQAEAFLKFTNKGQYQTTGLVLWFRRSPFESGKWASKLVNDILDSFLPNSLKHLSATALEKDVMFNYRVNLDHPSLSSLKSFAAHEEVVVDVSTTQLRLRSLAFSGQAYRYISVRDIPRLFGTNHPEGPSIRRLDLQGLDLASYSDAAEASSDLRYIEPLMSVVEDLTLPAVDQIKLALPFSTYLKSAKNLRHLTLVFNQHATTGTFYFQLLHALDALPEALESLKIIYTEGGSLNLKGLDEAEVWKGLRECMGYRVLEMVKRLVVKKV